MISSFEDLKVWEKAHETTILVYKMTKAFPSDEKFGIISQLRRATLSIQTNIAEGSGRRTTKDFIGFIYIAIGSLQEVRSLLRVSRDLSYISNNDFKLIYDKLMSILMMLNKMVSSLSARIPNNK